MIENKIYIAGSFSNKHYIEKIANILENEGFEITQKWWYSNLKDEDGDIITWLKRPDVEGMFIKNFEAIIDADILLIVFNPNNTLLQGALVELGIASVFSTLKKVIAIGRPNHKSAMFVPISQFFDNIEDAIEFLKDEKYLPFEELKK